MAGLIALLDDVAGIAKVAAASVDDITGMAAKAGAKAAGAVIDDAAVTPKYVHGFDANRELPIIWKIAKGSIFNKVVILLPIALLLSAFAPWLISPLLMLGGSYLCFEGAEKVYHAISPEGDKHDNYEGGKGDPAKLEETKVAGAIKTDFILSAEIMTIALNEVTALMAGGTLVGAAKFGMEAGVLFVVALAITVIVYGSVALIVKADDVGVSLAKNNSGLLAALGRGIVKFMPGFMKLLTIIGTAAMIWVGGNIIVHGLHEMGWHAPYEWISNQSKAAAAMLPQAAGIVSWFVTAFFDGILGLIWGLLLIPLSEYVIVPAANATIVPLIAGIKSLFGGSTA
ncbi:DUF808 domain-containing protein [Paracoccus aerodenitrificans]|uniref:DUF808 domain-containing protein n=1 Tax=Paracoccus aerodenitrificans TaxID=3017781 RepID=UPI0022F078A6|nr:DUF808 domain-containing protein [Paracoccus aerodenitrificans]WBU63409.1 DUF808 domain-containing protein [Paracoccus aerodenitrificans]